MDRHPSCKFYARCLDAAAYADEFLFCEGCRRYWPVKLSHDRAIDDYGACMAMWTAVFELQVGALFEQGKAVLS